MDWREDARRGRAEMKEALERLRRCIPVPDGDREQLLERLRQSGAQVMMCSRQGQEPTLEDLRAAVHDALVLAAYDEERRAGWDIGRSSCSCCPPPGNRRQGQHQQASSPWFHAPGGEWRRLGVKGPEARSLIDAFGSDPEMRDELIRCLEDA